MAIRDLFDYLRTAGDRRLRRQGYSSSGQALLERSRRAGRHWQPHLENNRRAILDAAAGLGPERGGTLLVLGAGRLLDVPWEELFPRFERAVLLDADAGAAAYASRLLSATRVKHMPALQFEVGDLSGSVVETADQAEEAIRTGTTEARTVSALIRLFAAVDPPPAPWERAWGDVRMAVSSNLLSQLDYFPRQHVQTWFWERFEKELYADTDAAVALEEFFKRVRARHVLDLATLRSAWVSLSLDLEVVSYALNADQSPALFPETGADVRLNEFGELRFPCPITLLDRQDPLEGQRVEELWPRGTPLEPTREWVWHIIPQGTEKKYEGRGRLHIVQAWVKRPAEA